MKSNTTLDYAVFQLSPKRSHCELVISSNDRTEKLASGLLKPFLVHMKFAEEQAALQSSSVKLEVGLPKHGGSWFTKGTLERFVRFVSTPEILEKVNSFDVEMSQLEAARSIYSLGAGTLPSGEVEENVADATKKELLRAIDVRVAALKHDLSASLSRASSAGFNLDTVTGLQSFAECFGAQRLNEACTKFIALCQRRPDLVSSSLQAVEEQTVRASWESDMSIDDSSNEVIVPPKKQPQKHVVQERQLPSKATEEPKSIKETEKPEVKKAEESPDPLPAQPSHPARRLSVQDRINMFENKQKENYGGKPSVSAKSVDQRRMSYDVAVEKTVLRRWSGSSDMSIDLANEKKETSIGDSSINTPSSSSQAITRVLTDDGSSYVNDPSSSVKIEEKRKTQIENSSSKEASSVSSTLQPSFKAYDPPKSGSKEEKSVTSEVYEQSYASQVENHIDVGSSNNFASGRKAFNLESLDHTPSHLSGRSTSKAKSNQSVKRSGSAESTRDDVKAATIVPSIQKPTERARKHQQPTEEQRSVSSSMKTLVPSKKVLESEETVPSQSETSVDNVPRTRNLKVNQELNDELKVKANELEKLFAEHKLRAPGDHSASMRRTKPLETKAEAALPSPASVSQATGNSSAFYTPPTKAIDADVVDDSRGKFYEKYRQKRDAKLREEWGSKRAEKEAKMKSLNDSLERSKAEMRSLSSSFGRRKKLEKQQSFSALEKELVLDSYQSEEDESVSEFADPKSKKTLPSRNLSRISAAPSKLSSKATSKRNLLAQSVPNFPEFKKETVKAKPIANKSQQRSLARSKSATDEAPTGNEKPRRQQASKKVELKNTDDEKTEATQNEQLPKGSESKPFLRKGYGIGPGAGASIRRQKASVIETVKNEEEMESSGDEFVDAKKEVETIMIDEENEKSGLSQESEKMVMSDSDNGEPIETQIEDPIVPELVPEESPSSWNSPHEASDPDAFVESPTGSPASWNFNALSAADVEAARMRKKWGSAHKPVLVANIQARKDVTKGFKRLLKFGRKNRGTENLGDWISATTSEGDDDTEDGNNRSSDDFRKSRMGHLPDDQYNDGDLFDHGLQSSIPMPSANFKMRDDAMSGTSTRGSRSFFSLPSFRSKASDSKPR